MTDTPDYSDRELQVYRASVLTLIQGGETEWLKKLMATERTEGTPMRQIHFDIIRDELARVGIMPADYKAA